MSNTSNDDLAKLISSIKLDLGKKFDEFRSDIDARFSTQIIAVKEDINIMQHRQDVLESRVDRTERLMHLTDLIANGIPKEQNEDLKTMFDQICKTINFVPKDYTLQTIFRTKNQSKFSSVIMKFISSSARNEFYTRYLKHKNLNLSDIGFTATGRIYINESLSTQHADIFRQVMILKKNNQVHSYFTQNGFVYIKLQPNEKAVRLVNSMQLSHILKSSNTDVGDSNANKRKINNTSIDQQTPPKANDAKYFKQTATEMAAQSTPRTMQSSTACDAANVQPSSVKRVPSTITHISASQRTRHLSSGTLDSYLLQSGNQ